MKSYFETPRDTTAQIIIILFWIKGVTYKTQHVSKKT